MECVHSNFLARAAIFTAILDFGHFLLPRMISDSKFEIHDPKYVRIDTSLDVFGDLNILIPPSAILAAILNLRGAGKI